MKLVSEDTLIISKHNHKEVSYGMQVIYNNPPDSVVVLTFSGREYLTN